MSRTGQAGEPYTPREADVAARLHLSNKAIAAELGLSAETVRKHVSNVLRKAGVERRSAVPDVRLGQLLEAVDEVILDWRDPTESSLGKLNKAREAFNATRT